MTETIDLDRDPLESEVRKRLWHVLLSQQRDRLIGSSIAILIAFVSTSNCFDGLAITVLLFLIYSLFRDLIKKPKDLNFHSEIAEVILSGKFSTYNFEYSPTTTAVEEMIEHRLDLYWKIIETKDEIERVRLIGIAIRIDPMIDQLYKLAVSIDKGYVVEEELTHKRKLLKKKIKREKGRLDQLKSESKKDDSERLIKKHQKRLDELQPLIQTVNKQLEIQEENLESAVQDLMSVVIKSDVASFAQDAALTRWARLNENITEEGNRLDDIISAAQEPDQLEI